MLGRLAQPLAILGAPAVTQRIAEPPAVTTQG
jgi:hypothetical protein